MLGHKILHRILRKKFLKFTVQLPRQSGFDYSIPVLICTAFLERLFYLLQILNILQLKQVFTIVYCFIMQLPVDSLDSAIDSMQPLRLIYLGKPDRRQV